MRQQTVLHVFQLDECCKFNILSLGLLLYILHHALQLQLEDTVKHLESVSAILGMKGKPAVMKVQSVPSGPYDQGGVLYY